MRQGETYSFSSTRLFRSLYAHGVRSATVIIESRWGALGAMALLQSYGLMLAYFFADAIRHIAGSSGFQELPGHFLEVSVGLVFLAVFIFSQGYTLDEVSAYLKRARDPAGWFRETSQWQGLWRFFAALFALFLYFALLLGAYSFDRPALNIFILLGYQAFHLVASHWLSKRLSDTRPIQRQYVSLGDQFFRITMCMATAAFFYGLGCWMKTEGEPAGWMFQMMGAGIGVFTAVEILLEGIQGRTRDVIIEGE